MFIPQTGAAHSGTRCGQPSRGPFQNTITTTTTATTTTTTTATTTLLLLLLLPPLLLLLLLLLLPLFVPSCRPWTSSAVAGRGQMKSTVSYEGMGLSIKGGRFRFTMDLQASVFAFWGGRFRFTMNFPASVFDVGQCGA